MESEYVAIPFQGIPSSRTRKSCLLETSAGVKTPEGSRQSMGAPKGPESSEAWQAISIPTGFLT